ncbi:Methyltransferase type 11 [Beutenbergia cavernae DSM 12333]|uniref:Methyltransferase type 11 n=1 Tax=Beutenbergia cavernae (strain ATCC BAA-8 / DSM 12333 / CCUG 43141 / JCM 11478 / NBRC 16432 / NCIMB 13614 / HKI 0122) TaxID=471853 RepID=C5C5U6_BEUC1|nr:class I SAM-dependent methyltransferase [Beutenbergia cavernae]ACQ82304.1 Methyltransferase type 11 [Beutenbergia cavernae DSM 12333]
MSTPSFPTIHQHPLAYLLGLEGVALLRAFAGERDRAFTEARLADIRQLLQAAETFGEGHDVVPLSVEDGYRYWAPTYDAGPNGFWGMEEPLVRPLMAQVPPGSVVMDAACGTGRHTSWLAEQGYDVLGVDRSPDMLAIAREKVPSARFAQGAVHELPVAEASVDLVVVTLALSHVRDLGPSFAEFARVLRPGGHLVISDTRGLFLGSPLYPLIEGADGEFGYLPNWRHATSEYLEAALPLGLLPRHCREYPRLSDALPAAGADDGGSSPGTDLDPCAPMKFEDPARPPNVWEMMPWIEAASRAAYAGNPALIIWDFERE